MITRPIPQPSEYFVVMIVGLSLCDNALNLQKANSSPSNTVHTIREEPTSHVENASVVLAIFVVHKSSTNVFSTATQQTELVQYFENYIDL